MNRNMQIFAFVILGAMSVPIIIFLEQEKERSCNHHNFQYENDFMHTRNQRMQNEHAFLRHEMQQGQTIPPMLMNVHIYNINVEQEHPLAYPYDPSAPLVEIITAANNVNRGSEAAAIFGEENVITTPLTANVWNHSDRMVNDFIGEMRRSSINIEITRYNIEVAFAAQYLSSQSGEILVTPTTHNMTPWVRQFAQPNFEPAPAHIK